MATPAEIRARAAALLSRIIVRRQTTDQVLESQDHDPLLLELLYGSLRRYFSLSRSVEKALHTPLRVKDQDLHCLMIVGLYQLHHTRIPPHAALHETVEAVRLLGKPWAKGLVNAVLRNAPAPERSFEHPPWMQRALRDAYGDLAPAIMLADNERAPMALRINQARIDPGAYRARLREAGLQFRDPRPTPGGACGWGPETVVLQDPTPVARLPGYREGLVSVQDAGGQLAAAILAPVVVPPGDSPSQATPPRVLDACAAPGGKLFHLLERFPGLDAVAIDSSATRLATLDAEARRLNHDRYLPVVADATSLDWWDEKPFDYVLIDAPCSGSGTLRRHPDIKILRQAADLSRYAELQGRLLATLWQTLIPGGTLLYCTCSVFPAENDDMIGPFLERHADAAVSHFELPTGRATSYGWQLLPTDVDTDGFYFARVRKVPG